MSKPAFVLLCTLMMSMMLASLASAQNYPSRPVRIIVAFSPGGPIDLIARPVGQKLSDALGQPFIVDFKPGANAVIGAEYVVKSLADGHTLLLFSGGHTVNPSTQKSLPYDTLKDLSAVSPIGRSDIILIVNPKLPIHNLRELIALAKARPEKLNFASTGTGGSVHLGGELFKLVAGIDMVHVPYKGAGPALQDLVAGTADMAFLAAPPVVAQIKAGKVRLIAVASLKRATSFPETATVEESGFPGFEIGAGYGFVAPAATSRAIINRLNSAVEKLLATPEIRQSFNNMGLEPWWSTPEQLQTWLREDVEKWQAVTKAIRYQAE